MQLDPFVDEYDTRLARGAGEDLVAILNRLGVFEASDVHVARRICAAADDPDPLVALALAFVVRALRGGSVCVDLAQLELSAEDLAGLDDEVVPTDVAPSDLALPELDEWLAALRESSLADVALRLEGSRLYLDRYWREEQSVAEIVTARIAATPPVVDLAEVNQRAAQLFPVGWDEQRQAALAAACNWTTVITGGPGTGKTTSVAGLLGLLAGQTPGRLRVALTAPTGKAAARLQESLAESAHHMAQGESAWFTDVPALTLHRLLGWRPDSTSRFKHDRHNRLGYDLIVVDEASMVPLTMMARLLEAIRPDTRLVLVGDPDQLTSVEAGAVLADLVAGLASRAPQALVRLEKAHRYGGDIEALAGALRAGDADLVESILLGTGDEVSFVPVADEQAVAEVLADLGDRAVAMQRAAERGERQTVLGALNAHRTLCAHREGPYGVATMNFRAERAIADELGVGVGVGWGREWYAGRPVLVNTNDYSVGLFNGDVGVTLQVGDGLRVVMADGREFATSRLGGIETMHALTIHKSQGGQADEVTVIVPADDSRLLTRELLYTAVTRAKRRVRIVGSLGAVRNAVQTPAARASGLRERLTGLDQDEAE